MFQNKSDVDVTILSNEESDVEDYHMVTGANRQLHGQNSQNPNDKIGSHADKNLPNVTSKPSHLVKQTALAIEQKHTTIIFPPEKQSDFKWKKKRETREF